MPAPLSGRLQPQKAAHCGSELLSDMKLPHQYGDWADRFDRAEATAAPEEAPEPECPWDTYAANQRQAAAEAKQPHIDYVRDDKGEGEPICLSGGTLNTYFLEASDSLRLCGAAGPDARALAVGPLHQRTPQVM